MLFSVHKRCNNEFTAEVVVYTGPYPNWPCDQPIMNGPRGLPLIAELLVVDRFREWEIAIFCFVPVAEPTRLPQSHRWWPWLNAVGHSTK